MISRETPTKDRGVAVWIALRRVHRGGVANLTGHWFDSGHLMPGYLAEALDGLRQGGLVAVADDPEPGGLRRASVTDRGSARYLELRRIHDPGARVAVSTPHRWASSPSDQRSHLIAGRCKEWIVVMIAVCGHRMLWSVDTSALPTGRSCPTCKALAAALPAVSCKPHPRHGDISGKFSV